MSTIRPLATIAVLAALGVFLALKINEGEPALLEGGLAPAGVAMATPGAEPTEAPLFGAAVERSTIDEKPPAFGAATPSPPAGAFLPQQGGPTQGDAVGGDPALPPLPPMPGMNQAPAFENAPETPALPAPEGVLARPTATPTTPSGPSLGAAAMVVPAAPPYAAAPPADDVPLPASIPTARYADAPTGGDARTITGGVPSLGTATPGYAPTKTPPNMPAYPQSDTVALAPTGPAPPTAVADPSDADYSAAQAALGRGDLAEAHRLLSKWRGDKRLAPTRRGEINSLVSELAGTVIYDSREHRLEPPHTVRPGETLASIAQSYQVPWRLLAKINGVASADAVTPGQQLKVVRGPFAAELRPEDNELVVTLGGRYAGRFEANVVGLPSGVGSFRVERKGDPTTPSIVLGGGVTPVEIGPATPAARGGAPRINVASRDAAELTDILSVGSTVTIRR